MLHLPWYPLGLQYLKLNFTFNIGLLSFIAVSQNTCILVLLESPFLSTGVGYASITNIYHSTTAYKLYVSRFHKGRLHTREMTNLSFSFIISSYDICPVHTFLWKFTVGYGHCGRCTERIGLSEARHTITEHLDRGKEKGLLYTNQKQLFWLRSHW